LRQDPSRAGFCLAEARIRGNGSSPGVLLVQSVEDEAADVDDDVPMTLTELGDSIRRELGAEVLLAAATRLSRWQFQARQARRCRDGRILVATDAAHLLPPPARH
jgi:2-polyprenyl-6-methoxyphenol hydroxylase-like FAD-dependent oxidoreductase